MAILFYSFVILGLLFYIYLIPAWILDKKRDKLIDDMEKQYTKKKFHKCPSCGVLNPIQSRTCEFCQKPLPGSPPPGEQPPGQTPEPQPLEGQKDLSPLKPGAGAPSRGAQIPMSSSGRKSGLESFFYKTAWPIPNSTALITITSIYLAVIFIYGFVAGIYTLGKQGVKQVEEASTMAARRHAGTGASQPQSPSIEEPMPPSQEIEKQKPVSVRTPTPVPSPTPLQLSGSEDEQIEQLMLYLENKDWNIAVQARKMLVARGKKAALALVRELNHPDAMMRTHVITALGELKEPETAPALINALDHADPLTRIQAVTALGHIRAQGVFEALLKTLKHPDWRMRQAAIVSLKIQRNTKAIPELERLQADPNERLRTAAKEALIALESSQKY